MTKEELIKQCRYFKGEAGNPYTGKDQDKSMFWDYERMWVEQGGVYEDPEVAQDKYLESPCIAKIKKEDAWWSVPVSLQILLFNRYVYWLGGYAHIERDLENYVKRLRRTYIGEIYVI